MTALGGFTRIGLLLLCACVGGTQTGDGGGNGSGRGTIVDAAIDARVIMWPDAAPGMGNNLPCKNPATPPGDGQHNTGRSCFQSCHNHRFTLAGTLYTNATGNSGFSGATITITDANGKTIDIVTHRNGNFWTMEPLAFPVLVLASSCPSAVKMEASSATGDCNSCHVGGTNDQMHLP